MTVLTPTTKAPTGSEHITHLSAITDSLYDDLYKIQLAIHDNPEIAWEESFAHDTATAYMESQGWTVTRHAYGLETAWEATFEVGTGGPVIGYNSEMDALKGVGHACGHNLICIAGMAAAIATIKLLQAHDQPGKVILLGTPAEEAYGGKAYMLKAGAYDEMEACLMTHPYDRGNGSAIPSMACQTAFSVVYKGQSSHAAGAPELGVNALDAAVATYNNISLLRQQIPDGQRVHLTIHGSEGWTSNVITNYSRMVIGIRSPESKTAFDLITKVINCMKAGALATGCSYEIRREALYMDVQHSDELVNYYREVCGEGWSDYPVAECKSSGSTDFGNVSYHIPALHPVFQLPGAIQGDHPHTDTYASQSGTPSATRAALKSAVAIAAVGSRMLFDRSWAAEVRASWASKMDSTGMGKIAKRLEALMDTFPMSPEASAGFCGHDHGNGNGNGH